MATTGKRDNAYWLHRLEKDGHGDLLVRVEAGELSVFKATQLAGYRDKARSSPADNLAYHWKRASAAERRRFVLAHLKDVNRVIHEVRNELVAAKEQKSRESEQN
jgi:hypothetical protein